MNLTLRTFGILGILLFGTAFWFTFGVPGYVEQAAKGFIKGQIEKETKEKVASLSQRANGTKLGKIAKKMIAANQDEIARIKQQLDTRLHDKIAAVIAEMGDLSCECRNKYAAFIKKGFKEHLATLKAANEKLKAFMKMKYMEIVSRLLLDLRIFTGSNLAVFMLLLLISFFKPQVVAHLFLPGILLFLSTLICSYFYLFNQNWFFTIVYSDYVGFGYSAYVAALFCIFCDIVFNSARITTEIINGIFSSIGSAFTVTPC